MLFPRLGAANLKLACLFSACIAIVLVCFHTKVAAAPIETAATSTTFYVATDGNDSWNGTLASPNTKMTNGPFASLAKAQEAVEALRKSSPTTVITVQVRRGTYYLPLSHTKPGTLTFSAADSGSDSAPVTWENFPEEHPVVSGGMPVSGWTHVSGTLWQAKLPGDTQPFETIFYRGHRRLRARLESGTRGVGYYMQNGSCISTQSRQMVKASLCNLGTFLRVAAVVSPSGSHAGCPKVTDNGGSGSKCLDRFHYDPKDPITKWINLTPPKGNPCGDGSSGSYPTGDVEITMFNAFTSDIMRVSCVDTTNHVIYFSGAMAGNPAQYNFSGPAPGHRFVVENARDAFSTARSAGQTGIFFLDRSGSSWKLNYLANPNENPATDTVVIPQLGGSIPGAPATDYVGASLLFADKLKNVIFSGITFEVDNYRASSQGFNNDGNESLAVPQAIDCEGCQNVTFDGITVRHTSASGLLLAGTGKNGVAAVDDMVKNSAFYDVGGAGIRIGRTPTGNDWPADVPHSITIQNNVIQGFSRVFPDGEGIAMGNGHDVTLAHNDIDDGYHTGIAICGRGCPSHNWSANGFNVLTQYNHLWNLMQGITSDGGALYYDVGSSTGSGWGNRVLNNLVHDVTDASIIDTGVMGSGYGGHGIYLDIQTAGLETENNVVYRVSSSGFMMPSGPAPGHAANTFNNNIVALARQAMFNEQSPWPQNCTSSLRVKITHNLFYFDLDDRDGFYPIVGCADSCGMDYSQFQYFQGNLYWRKDGGFSGYGLAFHVLTNPPAPNHARSCTQPVGPKAKSWTFFGFSEWQHGAPKVGGSGLQMNEDEGGTVSKNPGFGDTGQPNDFLLSSSPVSGFDYSQTNDTIKHAGRNNPGANAPTVAPTFPTYTYGIF